VLKAAKTNNPQKTQAAPGILPKRHFMIAIVKETTRASVQAVISPRLEINSGCKSWFNMAHIIQQNTLSRNPALLSHKD